MLLPLLDVNLARFQSFPAGQMSVEATDIRKTLPRRLFNIETGFLDDITEVFDFMGQASLCCDIFYVNHTHCYLTFIRDCGVLILIKYWAVIALE